MRPLRLLVSFACAVSVVLFCFDARADPRVLYLNRCAEGPVIWPAWEDDPVDDLSAVLEYVAEPPPYPYGYTSWRDVVATTRRLFAPFDIEVADEDPGDTLHDEVFVCGGPWHAGLDFGFWGLAPFHCEPPDSAVSFVFPEAIGNAPEEIGATVAQEAAHAWGLDHSLSCRDPMSYAAPCGERDFQDRDLACGEYFARPCGCGGDRQNTYARLAEVLGEREVDWAASRAPPGQAGCRVGSSGQPSLAFLAVVIVLLRRARPGGADRQGRGQDRSRRDHPKKFRLDRDHRWGWREEGGRDAHPCPSTTLPSAPPSFLHSVSSLPVAPKGLQTSASAVSTPSPSHSSTRISS